MAGGRRIEFFYDVVSPYSYLAFLHLNKLKYAACRDSISYA